MSRDLFVLDADGEMRLLSATPFLSEDDLQSLLAYHPELLAVGGGKLLLIAREQGVRDGEGKGVRWSLDHLFVTRDGVPVLVEVKRAADTRARREVIAQMLDYAANGPAHWETDEIVRAHRATCAAAGRDPAEVLGEFLQEAEQGDDPEADADAFWRKVEANLRAGNMRLLFVADRIAPELRRIVEFLNEQMRPAEVLAIEVAHYADPTSADAYQMLAYAHAYAARDCVLLYPTIKPLPALILTGRDLGGAFGDAPWTLHRRGVRIGDYTAIDCSIWDALGGLV